MSQRKSSSDDLISTIQISPAAIEGNDIGPPAGAKGKLRQDGKSGLAQQAADAALYGEGGFRLASVGAKLHGDESPLVDDRRFS